MMQNTRYDKALDYRYRSKKYGTNACYGRAWPTPSIITSIFWQICCWLDGLIHGMPPSKSVLSNHPGTISEIAAFNRLLGIDSYDALLSNPVLGKSWAVEIKHDTAPKLDKHYNQTCEDVGATKKYVVYGGDDEFPVGYDVTVISLAKIMEKLQAF